MVMRFFFNCHIAACGGGYTWWQILARVTKSLILSQKIQLIEFLMIFLGGGKFFRLSHRLCEGGYTCNFHSAVHGDTTIFKKIASPSQAKNRLCCHSFTQNL